MSKTVIRKWLLLGLGVTKDMLLKNSERQITPYGENMKSITFNRKKLMSGKPQLWPTDFKRQVKKARRAMGLE